MSSGKGSRCGRGVHFSGVHGSELLLAARQKSLRTGHVTSGVRKISFG